MALGVALLALLPVGGADVIDDTLSQACAEVVPPVLQETCAYQADAFVPGDAEGSCQAATRTVHVDAPYLGTLVPKDDDVSDAYHLAVPPELVGVPLLASVTSLPGVEPVSAAGTHRLAVHAPKPDGEPCGLELGSATPGVPFTFVPAAPGRYGLVITHENGTLLPPVNSADSCHLMCFPVVDQTVYKFRVRI